MAPAAAPRPKNRLCIGFLTLLGLATPTRAGASESRPAPMSVTAAAFLAEVAARDPRLSALEAHAARAEAAVAAAGRRDNPALSLEREEVFPDGGGRADHRLAIAWPIPLGGRREASVRAARHEAEAASAEREGARADLLWECRAAYDEAALAVARVERLAATEARLAALAEAVARRGAAGQTSRYEQDRVQLELAAWVAVVADAVSARDEAFVGLGVLAGRPEQPLAPSEPLALPTVAPLPSTGEWLAARPDRRAALARLAAADAARVAADRAAAPELVVAAGVMTRDEGGDGVAWGYVAGLSLDLPIFARAPGERERADADAAAAAATLAAQAQHGPAQVQRAHRELARAVARAELLRSAELAPLESLLRSVDAAYREGERSVFEVIDAYRTARELALRELALVAAARDAERALMRALGRGPLSPPEVRP